MAKWSKNIFAKKLFICISLECFVCVTINPSGVFVCIVHSHAAGCVCSATLLGVCLEAIGLVSPETCTGSFPGQTAKTLPELAKYQTLDWNVVVFFFPCPLKKKKLLLLKLCH